MPRNNSHFIREALRHFEEIWFNLFSTPFTLLQNAKLEHLMSGGKLIEMEGQTGVRNINYDALIKRCPIYKVLCHIGTFADSRA